jgi:hypothetical protein
MPALQPYVNPVWNRQDLAQRAQLRSGTKSRRNEVPDDLCIKRISYNADSRVTQCRSGLGLFGGQLLQRAPSKNLRMTSLATEA